ncbi:MAG: indole-3-glycerol phosphate synthase TrpC [Fimbriimonadaceae bacterium]|nr:indole-3-glycerol phosphate synthase TrpC [Fimbriimonadaceae bacterium]
MSRLARIYEVKREELDATIRAKPLAEVVARAKEAPPPLGFRAALAESSHPVSLIAEVKKASPSRGTIRDEFDPEEVALAYKRAGAECLSVLTDAPFFAGSAANLVAAKRATGLPCLRKDFLFDAYQVYESRALGADAVLLIVAGIDAALLSELHDLARALAMDVLVEAHTQREAETALEVGAVLVGVNNRDLATFETDLATAERILPMLPKDCLAVAESGLESRPDVERMRGAGARAVLIGTAFCAAPDIEAKVREVMGR